MFARYVSLLAVLLPALGFAQEADSRVTVPALTPVVVRLEELISSKNNKTGDRFRITVAEDVRVGDALVIPAGSAGEGEVVHAAKSGAGGKAGELILAARFVRVGDIDIRLRSFALGVAGKDQTGSSLAASMVIGPFALFVKGGVITVPPETLGIAKTALEFKLPLVVSPTLPPAVQTEETITGGEHEPKVD
jgi:hypothetical protein